jgi:predicted ATPase
MLDNSLPFLTRIFAKPGAILDDSEFPTSLPFVKGLDLRFERPVTFLVGENGSGKSTLMEALAELCDLPVGGGGKNERAGTGAPHTRSELAPFLGAAFRRRPREGYFFRAEFQAHFATLLDQRRDDPDFLGDPYARYGGRPLHARSHGEAFLAMLESWLQPGLLLMDEPESALSPQRQLALLANMATIVGRGGAQFIVATHSPILLTFPNSTLLFLDEDGIHETNLEDTPHYQITRGILEHPARYWRFLDDDS